MRVRVRARAREATWSRARADPTWLVDTLTRTLTHLVGRHAYLALLAPLGLDLRELIEVRLPLG